MGQVRLLRPEMGRWGRKRPKNQQQMRKISASGALNKGGLECIAQNINCSEVP